MHRLATVFALTAAAFLFSPLAQGVFAATDGPHAAVAPIPPTLTDWSSSLTFQQFNPALGTLTGVELDLSGSISTVISVTNSSLSSSSGTAKTEVQLSADDGSSNLAPPAQLDLLTPAFSYSLGPGGTTTSGVLTKSGTSSDLYSLAAVLAEFTGAGSITLPASTFTQTVLSNTGGNTTASQVTSASLDGSVTYFYNPVPEPGTLALLGIGAVALLACRRLRRRSA